MNNLTKILLLKIVLSSFVIGQGINPLKWYPIVEEDGCIIQAFEKVCVDTDILGTDGEECKLHWAQHQNELDIDNDGDMDFITQDYVIQSKHGKQFFEANEKRKEITASFFEKLILKKYATPRNPKKSCFCTFFSISAK